MATKYIAEPDNVLKCVICSEVARHPQQHTECGKLFCKECIEKHGKDKPCPNCNKEQPDYYRDTFCELAIQKLYVKCSNVDRECEWEGTVGTLEAHVATCEFTLFPCTNQCKDDKDEISHLMRKDLEKHLETECPKRDYKCEHCGEIDTFANITTLHDKICKKKIIPCPNTDCSETMPRDDIADHIDKCKYTMIPCKYKYFGCDTELTRRDMLGHEQDNLHLHVALDTVLLLQKKEISRESLTFKVSEYQQRKERREKFTSPQFSTSHGYDVSVTLHVNGNGDGHISFSMDVWLMRRKNKPSDGKIMLTLLNQRKDTNHFSIIVSIESAHPGSNQEFIHHSNLAFDPDKNTQYLKDDTLYFRVSVDIPDIPDYKPWLECTT